MGYTDRLDDESLAQLTQWLGIGLRDSLERLASVGGGLPAGV